MAAVTTPPSFESESPVPANCADDDADESVFYTPELFEDEASPQKENPVSPPRADPGPESSAPPAKELFESKRTQELTTTVSVSEQSTALSQGQKEGIELPKQSEKGVEDETQSRQKGSRPHRLSRSRQRVSFSQTGNHQPGHAN